jgi:nucleotide-binding universal stress UspA family protein
MFPTFLRLARPPFATIEDPLVCVHRVRKPGGSKHPGKNSAMMLLKPVRIEPMTTIQNILFPVDFSTSCVAMGALVKRAAALVGARVTLVHVFDLYSHDAFQLYVRPLSEVAEEQKNLARDKLDSFLKSEFPIAECARILSSGDAAKHIVELAKTGGFDLIVMPTHAGLFRRTLLGSTTAKVLNDADCPVLTTQHAETISPRLRSTQM